MINARQCNGRNLHDIEKNLMFPHFSRRDIFDVWYRSEDILERAKLCTYWLEMRMWHTDKRYTMQRKNLHDIDKNLTFTHFSRRDIFDAWFRSEDILERAKVCTYWLKMRAWHIDKREAMQWKNLHDIDTNLTFTHFSRRYIFDASYRSEYILERAKVSTYWLKMERDTLINARQCNGRNLHDIDTNLTFTHFSRRDIFDAWYRSEVILERAKVHTYWLKMRVWHTDKRETVQWEKPTWYRHESDVHELFT